MPPLPPCPALPLFDTGPWHPGQEERTMLQLHEQEQFDIWLRASGLLQNPCPICRVVGWGTGRAAALVNVSIGSHGRLVPDVAGACLPVAVLECSSCGLLLPFSLESAFPAGPDEQ